MNVKAFFSVVEKHECESELDCPRETPCSAPISYISNMELLIDDFNFSFGDIKKKCVFTVTSALEPHTGGGEICQFVLCIKISFTS